MAFLSGIITSTLVNPFWVLHSKMTTNTKEISFIQLIRKSIKGEGFKALFKGLSASLILVMNPIVQFIVYENLKKKFRYFSLFFK